PRLPHVTPLLLPKFLTWAYSSPQEKSFLSLNQWRSIMEFNSMRRSICLWLLIAAIFAGRVGAMSALAQVEQATITGAVTDKSGAVIPDAKVVVTNIRTQAVRETKTTGDGHYTVPYLPVGQYEVAVERAGFRRAQVKDVTLRVGFIATVDVSLEPGAGTEVLDVTGGAGQLESPRGRPPRRGGAREA